MSFFFIEGYTTFFTFSDRLSKVKHPHEIWGSFSILVITPYDDIYTKYLYLSSITTITTVWCYIHCHDLVSFYHSFGGRSLLSLWKQLLILLVGCQPLLQLQLWHCWWMVNSQMHRYVITLWSVKQNSKSFKCILRAYSRSLRIVCDVFSRKRLHAQKFPIWN